jgi:hypothetical protein
MLQKACRKFEFLSNNCSSKRLIFPSYCTGNMLQKACEKFVFLSNNCSAKKAYFSIRLYMLQKVCGKFEFLSKNCLSKRRIFPSYCFKKPVESLISCQTIVRQKRLIFPYDCVESLNSCQKIVRQKGVFFHPIVQASKSLWKV